MFAKWSSPAAAFQILKDLSRGQPCDFTGIRDHAHIESEGGIQWPFPDSSFCRAGSPNPVAPEAGFGDPALQCLERERRLFADGKFFTADGRAKFLFDEPVPLPEPTDVAYPFLLNTGRGSSAQWHTGSRTDKSVVLRKLAPNVPWIELNPADASALGVVTGRRVTVRSRRGSTTAHAVVTPIVQRGQVFMPMHFAEVNVLTFPAYDPHSRQPAYKACAVAVSPILNP
jgi:assimilatory nitrate reductase catalytic subunit